MNRERARELLPIIQAFADGGEIECRHPDLVWRHAHEFLGDGYEYRIKTKPREWWLWGPTRHDLAAYPITEYPESVVKNWGHYIKVREVLE